MALSFFPGNTCNCPPPAIPSNFLHPRSLFFSSLLHALFPTYRLPSFSRCTSGIHLSPVEPPSPLLLRVYQASLSQFHSLVHLALLVTEGQLFPFLYFTLV